MIPLKPVAVILLVAVTISACSSSSGPGPSAGGPPSRGNEGPGIDRLNQAYIKGVDLAGAGNCPAAIRRLTPVAMAGAGFEGAQHHLGACLISTASGDRTRYLEGLLWLRRSAEAGWPEAQGALAVEYVEGPIPDLREGALWLALYDRNPRRTRVAFTPLPAETLNRLRLAIPDTLLAAGEEAADSFQISVWEAPKSMRPSGRSSSGGRAVDGENRGRGPGRGERRERPADENFSAASVH